MDPVTQTGRDHLTAEHYPCDPELVQKGQSIPPHELGLSFAQQHTRGYQLALLRKRDEVMRMMDDIKRPVSIVCKKGTLYVLTDSEAAVYHDKRASDAMSGIGRQSKHLRHRVDRSKLSEEEQSDYDKVIRIHAARYLSARSIHAGTIDRIQARGTGEIPRHLGQRPAEPATE